MDEFVREDCIELLSRESVLETTSNQDQGMNPPHGEGRARKSWDHAQLGHVNTHTSR